MDDLHLQLLSDLHKDAARQGPGSDAETRLAIRLSGLKAGTGLKIADIGCGTGAPTRVLARELDAQITAIDFLPEFLARLERAARKSGLASRIETMAISMDALPFADGELDAIWSEGAIYNLGFETGVRQWRRFLKPGGILAVSEITWLTDRRPRELESHWQREYPQIDTAPAKMKILQDEGYTLIGYFVLPEHCWLENYYRPLGDRLDAFVDAHDNSDAAKAIAAAERIEISLYERYRDYYSYGFYIARKTGD